MKMRLLLPLVLLYPLFYGVLCAEDVKLVTYYPSPYGEYEELRAKRMAVGENYVDPVYYEYGAQWASGASLISEGNVGIGTPAPGGKLHVTSENDTVAMELARFRSKGGNSVVINSQGKLGVLLGQDASAMLDDPNLDANLVVNSQFGWIGLGGDLVDEYGMGFFPADDATSLRAWVVYNTAEDAVVLGGGPNVDVNIVTDLADGIANNIRLLAEHVGVNVYDPVNTLDVNGGVAIGSGYAGAAPAPANGMIVEGNVGIGTDSPQAALDVRGRVIIADNDAIIPGCMFTMESDEVGSYDEEFMITLSGNGGHGDDKSSIFIGPNPITGGVGRVELDAKTIFVDHANVGIGLQTPTSRLEVAGTAYLRGAAGGNGLYVASNSWVGIRNTDPAAPLDVNGEVKVGNSGLPCNGSTAGAMRYNSGQMEYCDGSSWRSTFQGQLQAGWFTSCPAGWVRTFLTDCDTGDGHKVDEDTCNHGGPTTELCIRLI